MSNREQFIAKMCADGCPDTWQFQDDGTGGFHNHATEWAWIAWNRAIESQAAQIAALTAERDALDGFTFWLRSQFDALADTDLAAIHVGLIREKIDAARTQAHKEPKDAQG